MVSLDYLKYTAETPMTQLRKRFNHGENLHQQSPATLSGAAALADVLYLKYVFENAYSGYTYLSKAQCDDGFEKVMHTLHRIPEITPPQLIDLIGSQFSFITDGHLALTTSDYGKGFYAPLRTFVSDRIVKKVGEEYFDLASGKQVILGETGQAFPTITNSRDHLCLIGVRSKVAVKSVTVQMDGASVDLPLHRIRSREIGHASLMHETYQNDVAIISSSSFVGDAAEDIDRFYEVGRKCRRYPHVIWDLSNNSGGNSEFPKQFLLGLYGTFHDPVETLALQSPLVHAKETGIVEDIPRQLRKMSKNAAAENDAAVLFHGQLHVIINDQVASSAELAVAWANTYPRVTFYGCNSLGIGRFGDLHIYYLPNSKITLWCPQKVFDTGIEEAVGFSPNYWIDRDDVVSVVLENIAKKR